MNLEDRSPTTWWARGKTWLVLSPLVLLAIWVWIGHSRVTSQINNVKDIRVEKVDGKRSWTLVYEMHDGTELECVTIEGMVVAAEPRE